MCLPSDKKKLQHPGQSPNFLMLVNKKGFIKRLSKGKGYEVVNQPRSKWRPMMIFDMPTCGACRTCEIACSYHHISEFNPYVSSIKILDKQGGSGYSVLLIEEFDGQNIPCDGCHGLEEPLCLEVCKEKEALREIIEEHMRTAGQGKKIRNSHMTHFEPLIDKVYFRNSVKARKMK